MNNNFFSIFWMGCTILGLIYLFGIWDGLGSAAFIVGQIIMGIIGIIRENQIKNKPPEIMQHTYIMGSTRNGMSRLQPQSGNDKTSEIFVGKAYESNEQIIIIGKPNDDEALPEEQRHNCDAMGCGQAHVLYRFNKE